MCKSVWCQRLYIVGGFLRRVKLRTGVFCGEASLRVLGETKRFPKRSQRFSGEQCRAGIFPGFQMAEPISFAQSGPSSKPRCRFAINPGIPRKARLTPGNRKPTTFKLAAAKDIWPIPGYRYQLCEPHGPVSPGLNHLIAPARHPMRVCRDWKLRQYTGVATRYAPSGW